MNDKIKESHPLPDSENHTQNLEDMKVVEVEQYGVFEWHPLKDGKGKPEMVMLTFKVEGLELSIRLKSKGELLRLIKMLKRHGDNVWPEQG